MDVLYLQYSGRLTGEQKTVTSEITDLVAPLSQIGATALACLLAGIGETEREVIDASEWDISGTLPVPSVIQATTSIFADNDVRQIAQADASNSREAASHVVDLIGWAKRSDKPALTFVT